MEDLTSIEKLTSLLTKFIDGVEPPSQTVPAPLILLGGSSKKGLSAREVTKEIISKSQQLGIPIGQSADGEESIWEKQIYNIVSTIFEHIITNAKISVVIPAGTPVTVTGGNAGGPIVCQGQTINITSGYAIIQ